MNRLGSSRSPYLLQHAANPVDWFPWGPEALEKAKREDKPIFLSIGYSACHWCHVMAHESFEDPQVAKVMNALYVNIKVDREERPDLDHLYMQAVMAMTGSGGWPMSVFLTPDLEPFFGGTYFPPTSRHGHPGFRSVLEGIARAWKERRADIVRDGGRMAEALQGEARLPAGPGEVTRDPLPQAAEGLKKHFDTEFAGFGGAPKFPPSMDLEVLLREHARTGEAALLSMVEATLDRMARGGMYDQLGGGFHRYSTDDQWLIPHFEKMLYDNALLARVYLHAWQVTGKAGYARIVREVCEYVLREMTDPAGGFYAAQDADSEHEEGKFFAWTPAEIREVLGAEDAEVFCKTYDVSPGGNFEHGKSALWLPQPVDAALEARLAPMRAKLFAVRGKRVKPGLDSKILADWNGLMVRALAEAGWALDEPRWLDAARKAAAFCLGRKGPDGRLLHAEGIGAFLDDHAFLASGCLALFEATGEGRWLMEATVLAEEMEKRFHDQDGGGAFFFTAADHEKLPVRSKHPGDNALPSGNSVAAMVLLRLAALTGEGRWRALGEKTLSAFAPFYARQPRGFAEMLCGLDFAMAEPMEIVVTGTKESRKPLLDVLRGRFLPNALILPFDPEGKAAAGMVKAAPLLEGKALVGGKPAAYVCRGGTCQAPVTSPDGLSALLR